MTTTEPKPETISRYGHHVAWCTNHGDGYEFHSEDEPYCSKQGAKVSVIPEGDVVKRQVWVNSTRSFTHGDFTHGQLDELESTYDGVEIFIETWRGPGWEWEDQRVRITSDAARTMAAALIRAADIEQGLTR